MLALKKKLETYKIQNIRHFLQIIPSNDRSKISEGVHLYMNIWNKIVCPRIDTYLSIKLQFREQLSLESPLKYFLPTRNINSCCALVTMNFLITRNNELLEKYRRACRVETQLVLTFSIHKFTSTYIKDFEYSTWRLSCLMTFFYMYHSAKNFQMDSLVPYVFPEKAISSKVFVQTISKNYWFYGKRYHTKETFKRKSIFFENTLSRVSTCPYLRAFGP